MKSILKAQKPENQVNIFLKITTYSVLECKGLSLEGQN